MEVLVHPLILFGRFFAQAEQMRSGLGMTPTQLRKLNRELGRFLFMFLSAAGLIRFAVYPVLVFYFFPFPIFREKLMYLLDKWDDSLNAIPPDEFEE